MGKSRRIKTKRIVDELLQKYPDKFTTDFEENKSLIEEVMTVSSKEIRNKIAGYLTSTLNSQSKENL